MFIVISRCFYVIYLKMSRQCRVPLRGVSIFRGISNVFQGRSFSGCFKEVFRVFQRTFKEVSSKFEDSADQGGNPELIS